jgi:uncharacterized repeat protein (TIGR03809 family)
MPATPGLRFDEISRRWLGLAERRLIYYAGLYKSGRWQRYYTPEGFAQRIVDVMKAVTAWRALAGEPAAPEKNDFRPAA